MDNTSRAGISLANLLSVIHRHTHTCTRWLNHVLSAHCTDSHCTETHTHTLGCVAPTGSGMLSGLPQLGIFPVTSVNSIPVQQHQRPGLHRGNTGSDMGKFLSSGLGCMSGLLVCGRKAQFRQVLGPDQKCVTAFTLLCLQCCPSASLEFQLSLIILSLIS